MRRTTELCCLILLTAVSFDLNGQTNDLFPKLATEDGFVEELSETHKKQFINFFLLNPSYLRTGNYKWADAQFTSLQYPVVNTRTSKDFAEFNAVQVIFREFIPFASRTDHAYYTFCHSISEFEHEQFYNLKGSSREDLADLNGFYKQRLTDLLSGKKARRVLITDMLDAKISFDDSLSNNVIMEFSLDNIYGFAPNVKNPPWPSCYQYSMNIIGVNGEVLQTYHQAIMFRMSRRQAPTQSMGILKSIMIPAFENLINQFLNDEATRKKVTQMNHSQRVLVRNTYKELNAKQFELLNIGLAKKKTLDMLKDLGYDVESISYESVKSTPVYNSSVSDETNQLIGSTADLVGNALLAGMNARKIKNTKLIGAELLARFEDEDNRERELMSKLNPEVWKGSMALFLPNNSMVTNALGSVVSELQEKTSQASDKLAAQKRAVITDNLVSVTSQVSDQVAKAGNPNGGSVETMAESTGSMDPNGPEAKACAAEAQQEWKNSCVYQRANDLSLVRYQHRYAILAKKKIAEILIAKCAAFISANEMAAYRELIAGLEGQFNSMGGWDGLDPGCR